MAHLILTTRDDCKRQGKQNCVIHTLATTSCWHHRKPDAQMSTVPSITDSPPTIMLRGMCSILMRTVRLGSSMRHVHWQGHSSQTYKCSSYSKLLIMWHDCEQVVRATRHVGSQQRAKRKVTSFHDSRQTNTPGNHIHLVENCHSLNKASQAQASEHEQ